ncbi:DALR anticodon-binding domain-containing protein [Nocardia jinanensis]|uniref:arginine--tRNA ligase n=1 Tax=Nocardia jinanensis TaxID=382504 RepID=A0A917RJB6_9NOCA|nr:DALR anticodon-binding domain-containing protein [Nocardia jinanensis]GGL11141.1 hypothetical protein GCM10011588_27040 [Nocardia jinanensis]
MSSLRKAEGLDGISVDLSITFEPAERELGLTLDGYGTVIDEVATLEPHRLAGYLYELARAFTGFYDTCPVLTAPEPVRGNRLALSQLTARTLGHGLGLLGIAAPERLWPGEKIPVLFCLFCGRRPHVSARGRDTSAGGSGEPTGIAARTRTGPVLHSADIVSNGDESGLDSTLSPE